MSGKTDLVPGEGDFEWMIVEIMGHRRHAGRVREEERFGAKMLRIDVPTVEWQPGADGAAGTVAVVGWVTHFYGGPAIFSATPSDEATVMRMEGPVYRPSRFSLVAKHDEEDVGDDCVN